MKYLAKVFWAWLVDWTAPKWAALKAKAVAAYLKVRHRNTGGK